VVLVPTASEHIDDLLDRVDGILIPGGGDIDPLRYSDSRHESARGISEERDEFEIEVALRAKTRRMPVFAICRGLQIVNVALGGSLIQDIPTETGSMDHTVIGHAVWDGHQPVRIDAGCRIAEAIRATDIMVNSIHHQAVKELAPGFQAVAWAADGIIEGIEYDDPAWPLLAVQWHPEYLGQNGDLASHALFDWLIEEARVDATV